MITGRSLRHRGPYQQQQQHRRCRAVQSSVGAVVAAVAVAAVVVGMHSPCPTCRVMMVVVVAFLVVWAEADDWAARTIYSLAVVSAVRVAVRIPAAAAAAVVAAVVAAAPAEDRQVSRLTASNPTMSLVADVADACSVLRRLGGRIGGLHLWDCRRRLSRVLVVSMSDERLEVLRFVGRMGLVFVGDFGDRAGGIVDTLRR